MYEDGRVKIEKISSSPPKFVPHKREARYNLSLKAGVYFPTDDLEEADNGFYGEISFNTDFRASFNRHTNIRFLV
jgi:hypothetical protein